MPDEITITLERETAALVRNALTTYRATLENVLADMGRYDPERRRDMLSRTLDAKLAVEKALGM